MRTHPRKQTPVHARYSDWPTRAEDTVDSGVIKELIVLRGNNTTTHDDYITMNKPTQKQSILNSRPLLYFSILIGPFYTTWRTEIIMRQEPSVVMYNTMGISWRTHFWLKSEKRVSAFIGIFSCCVSAVPVLDQTNNIPRSKRRKVQWD